MADPDTLSVLQRKTGAGQPAPDIPRLSATGALGNALRRAGQDVANVLIAAQPIDQGKAVLDEVLGDLPDRALLCLVEGPDSSFGLAVLDQNLMAGLVEAQTIGKVSATAAADRAPTRTDAAICADFVDRMLECFEVEAHGAQLDIAPQVSGYRYALPIMDPDVISLTLANVHYHMFRAELDLAGGAKQGVLTVILPCEAPARAKHGHATDRDTPELTVADVAMTCRAELRAILHQVHLPVTDVANLDVGMTIPVPLQALGQVALLDADDRVVTTCRLGRMQGQRAVRIGPAAPPHAAPEMSEPAILGSVASAEDAMPTPAEQTDIPAS
ncbi:FliM/FliN family flagellar motor switch protein [Aliiroseovarius sp. PrR006]|uniref:FliM/FliN family flagellar motor switch protein n=1 Tax=Aliiroseovarius sp. PrR006 TaxID=2706883 RepID=UPI0013D55199|nr:FliM/FliN family flagellar motor C-terminal domain-containing protein [Aliiroseovarius sp. PrR006]NDW53511.1 FliM/FliN family flagellar motor switch protein [Aliiroseovarius sp. PrR006]